MPQAEKLKELSFLVYGLGITGLSVINFFKRNEIKNFKVWDDKKKIALKKYRPKNLRQTLNQVDYIVLTPGISMFKNKSLKKFEKKIITDIDLFYLSNKNFKSIVVTGTNGKSTTCKLLEHLLNKNKIKCCLGGNIGSPILNIENSYNRYIIIEASSFQLSHSKFICPDFAFFLNLSTDHIDWHGSKTNYLNSKLKIFKLQTKNQYAIINENIKKYFIKKKFSSKLIIPKLKNYEKIKFEIKNRYLNSPINDENMNFLMSFARLLNIRNKTFIYTMKSFKGLPHRFEFFLRKNKTIFINDSKATSFKSSQIALTSLKNIYWILGGLPKKDDKINISKFRKNIIKCYIVGKNINFFKNKIKGKVTFAITRTLKNTIMKISKDSKNKKNVNKFVILSPAAASYDQFNNFEERGVMFKKLCRKYARKFF